LRAQHCVFLNAKRAVNVARYLAASCATIEWFSKLKLSGRKTSPALDCCGRASQPTICPLHHGGGQRRPLALPSRRSAYAGLGKRLSDTGQQLRTHPRVGGPSASLLRDPALASIGAARGCSTAAVALAWTIRNGNVIAIPESGSVAHVKENAPTRSR
jgi:hypothetical protein